ncbi:MAG: hypothetical protein U0736_24215 [Gemmataceae bacterium]
MSIVRPLWEDLVANRRPADADGWVSCPELPLWEAERFLDWLEGTGLPRPEVRLGERGVAFRWPGLRIAPEAA